MMGTAYPGALDDTSGDIPLTGANPDVFLGSTVDSGVDFTHPTHHEMLAGAAEALEAKVGIGASTPASGKALIATGTGITSWLTGPIFDVRAYGAVGNGSTNDAAAIQAAIDAAEAAGGGIVRGNGLHAISTGLTVQRNNVRLDFGQEAIGLSAVETGAGWYPTIVWTPTAPSSGLIWTGADGGGPMVTFSPAWVDDDTLYAALTGVGFNGSLYAGTYPFTTAADIGLYVAGVSWSHFPAVHAYEFNVAGVKIAAAGRTNSANQSDAVMFTRWDRLGGRQIFNSGAVLLMDGTAAGADAYTNWFGNIKVLHDVGYGIDLRWTDHNRFDQVEIRRPATGAGTAAGLRFAAATTDYRAPAHNRFGLVTLAYSSVESENGTTAVRSPRYNVIEMYQPDVSAPSEPTVGANSILYWWHEDRVTSKNTGDYSVSPIVFVLKDAVTNTTVSMSLGDAGVVIARETLKMPYAGYIVAMSCYGTTVTAGNITFRPTVNGAIRADPVLTYNGAVDSKDTAPMGTISFAADDVIGVDAFPSGTYEPSGANAYKVMLWVAVPSK